MADNPQGKPHMSTKMEWIIALKAERPSREKLDRVEDGKLVLSGLAPDTKLILTYIFTYATPNAAGELCAWPTISRLADETGKSRETIRKHLVRAESLGWLRGEEWGNPDNPLRRWYLLVPAQLNPRPGRQDREITRPVAVDHPAQLLTTGGQPLGRGGQLLVTPGQPLVTENVLENVLENVEEKAAATHAREPAPVSAQTREAAAASDNFQILKDEPKAANKPTAATSSDEPSAELVREIGAQLASRMASLVRKPGDVTPSMVRPALRWLKRMAGDDEKKVRAYLADELDRVEMRSGDARLSSPDVLMRWLVDKKAWSKWAAAAQSTSAAPGSGAQRDKSIPVGYPPRAGMKWNTHLGDWTNSTAIHTGLLDNLPGKEFDGGKR